MHDLPEILKETYGFPFPAEFFLWPEFLAALKARDIDLATSELGISEASVFDVFKPGFELGSFNPVEKSRYFNDPPEFFTIFIGHTDGLHWGYWVDEPNVGPPNYSLAYYYARDAFEISPCPGGIFATLEAHFARGIEDFEREKSSSHKQEDRMLCDKYLDIFKAAHECVLPSLSKTLSTLTPVPARSPAALTREGMGIVVAPELYEPLEGADPFGGWNYSPSAEDVAPMVQAAYDALGRGYPGTALKLGKDLWVYKEHEVTSADLMVRAYRALERPVLEAMVQRFRLPRRGVDLPEVRAALQDVQGTTGLYLAGKNIQALGEEVGELSQLAVLEVANNVLDRLPASLARLTSLERVYLNSNHFTDFPLVLGELPALRMLNLSYNPLSDIPEGVVLKQLTELRFSGEQWVEWPQAINSWVSLRTVAAKDVSIAVLPAGMRALTQLEELSISNKEVALERMDAQLEGLHTLSLGFVSHHSSQPPWRVPRGLEQQQSLRKLTIRCNQPVVFGAQLGALQQLEELRLDIYQLKRVPEFIRQLSGLKRLTLSGKPGVLPEWLGELEALEELSARACGLSTLPDALLKLPNLRKLDVSYNEPGPRKQAQLRERFGHLEDFML